MEPSTKVKKELRVARPRLKLVSPLAHTVVMIFGLFNLFLGISLLLAIDHNRVTSPLIIVNDVFSFRFWGIVFILLGIIKLLTLRLNSWSASRKSLLLGVAVKSAWAFAFIIRSTTNSGTWIVTILWVALAAIQIAAFIYFMPPSVASNKQPRGRIKT